MIWAFHLCDASYRHSQLRHHKIKSQSSHHDSHTNRADHCQLVDRHSVRQGHRTSKVDHKCPAHHHPTARTTATHHIIPNPAQSLRVAPLLDTDDVSPPQGGSIIESGQQSTSLVEIYTAPSVDSFEASSDATLHDTSTATVQRESRIPSVVTTATSVTIATMAGSFAPTVQTSSSASSVISHAFLPLQDSLDITAPHTLPALSIFDERLRSDADHIYGNNFNGDPIHGNTANGDFIIIHDFHPVINIGKQFEFDNDNPVISDSTTGPSLIESHYRSSSSPAFIISLSTSTSVASMAESHELSTEKVDLTSRPDLMQTTSGSWSDSHPTRAEPESVTPSTRSSFDTPSTLSTRITSSLASLTPSSPCRVGSSEPRPVNCVSTLPQACRMLSDIDGLAILDSRDSCVVALASTHLDYLILVEANACLWKRITLHTRGASMLQCVRKAISECDPNSNGCGTAVPTSPTNLTTSTVCNTQPSASPSGSCMYVLPEQCQALAGQNGPVDVSSSVSGKACLEQLSPLGYGDTAQSCLQSDSSATGNDILRCLELRAPVCDSCIPAMPEQCSAFFSDNTWISRDEQSACEAALGDAAYGFADQCIHLRNPVLPPTGKNVGLCLQQNMRICPNGNTGAECSNALGPSSIASPVSSSNSSPTPTRCPSTLPPACTTFVPSSQILEYPDTVACEIALRERRTMIPFGCFVPFTYSKDGFIQCLRGQFLFCNGTPG